MTNPQPGTDYDWDQPVQAEPPRRQRLHGAAAVRPGPARVPVAGSYVTGLQQESLLTSAWYELPPPDGTPAGGRHRRGHHRRRQRAQRAHRRPARRAEYARPARRSPVPAGRCSRSTSARRRPGATCATTGPGYRPTPPRLHRGSADRSLASGTGSPSRRRGFRSCGRCRSTSAPPQPVLMDWAVGFGLPVPAADAARQRSPRCRSSGSPGLSRPRSRTPTPGRTAATAVCSGSPTRCASA